MIGDVLVSSMLFEALKNEYPQSELHYLIDEHTFPVVEHNPFIDKFIFFKPRFKKNKLIFFKFLLSIKNEKYDVVIDIYSKLSSNLISLFSKSRVKISKYKWYTSFIYSKTYHHHKNQVNNMPLAFTNRLLLIESFLKNKNPFKIAPKIYLTDNEIKNARQFLLDSKIEFNRPLFMINVLGSAQNKTYPLSYMAKLIDYIVDKTEGQILFNYIPNQKREAQIIFDSCNIKTQEYIFFNTYGKSLREFIAITKHCNALIGNEGGAVNMAKAIETKTFTIFSPWIIKEAWNDSKENKNHVAIHLKDIKASLFKDKTIKKLKADTQILYKQFSPEMIEPKLKLFLSQF